jgi:hypothetical protein
VCYNKIAEKNLFHAPALTLADYNKTSPRSEKSSEIDPKVSKNLNRAEYIENLLGLYGAGATNLQYFCSGKKIV